MSVNSNAEHGSVNSPTDSSFDVIIVGAGFSGLRSLHSLRNAGLSVKIIEASDEVGGVWNHNRYPGARCDVESYDYSFGFSDELQQQWRWSERYAQQPEILRYANHVCDRFQLRSDILFDCRMLGADFNEDRASWTVATDSLGQLQCRHLILAVGQLSKIKTPSIPGAASFAGEIHHSGAYPREPLDFAGKRVGIIGTGSSGVQMTPVIARQAEHLSVFQRTANYSIPACHAEISDADDALVKATYDERREQARNSPSGLGFMPNRRSALDDSPEVREQIFETAWNRLGFGFALAYYDILLNIESNNTAVEFVNRKIAEKVDDPELCKKLTPHGFPFGAMRPAVDHGYYQAFNRSNVELVDIKQAPIEAITETGITTSNGEYPLDIIIYATGFDVFTGSILAPLIRGRNGLSLEQKWSQGPRNYLGIGTHDFPNLFVMVGPGSPSLLSNVIVSIEDHAQFICSLITSADSLGKQTIEVNLDAENDWVEHVNERAQETLYPLAPSYYMGNEVAGKPKVFMPYSGGVRGYRRILENVRNSDWKGFDIS